MDSGRLVYLNGKFNPLGVDVVKSNIKYMLSHLCKTRN